MKGETPDHMSIPPSLVPFKMKGETPDHMSIPPSLVPFRMKGDTRDHMSIPPLLVLKENLVFGPTEPPLVWGGLDLIVCKRNLTSAKQ